MIKKVKYGSFTTINWNKVTITNDLGQNWELHRVGISESEVKQFLKDKVDCDEYVIMDVEGMIE